MSEDRKVSETPLLSWSLFIGLVCTTVGIIFMIVWVLTCTLEETASNTYYTISGGQRIYSHPAIAITWMVAFITAALSGVANLFFFWYYNSKQKIRRIRIPFLGSVTVPDD